MHENMRKRTEYSIVVLCYGSGAKIPAFVENTIKLLLANDINDYELVLVGNYLDNSIDNKESFVCFCFFFVASFVGQFGVFVGAGWLFFC